MIPRPRPERFRLRRTMMFMNAQRPGLIKDAYIYGVDSIILDLEDAVAENQKDAARFSLYHALKSIDYGETEVLVRMNGLETPHWQEDIRVCVAGGADGVRIAKCESADDVKYIEEHVRAAEKEFGVEEGRTLLMAALESPKGGMESRERYQAAGLILDVAVLGGEQSKGMHVHQVGSVIEINAARSLMLLAARAEGIKWFDNVVTALDGEEGFRAEVELDHAMGFDGKSLINPRQIAYVHQTFAPTPQEIATAELYVRSFEEQSKQGVGVYTVNGKMVDIPFIEDASRVIALAKACGVYHGDL